MMTITNLICISAIVALCFVLTGCRRALPPGAVLFTGSGIAIIPGDDWQPMRSNVLTAGQKAICPPVLEGKGLFRLALIEVFTTAERADTQAGVANGGVYDSRRVAWISCIIRTYVQCCARIGHFDTHPFISFSK
jgi:hypothetical protein